MRILVGQKLDVLGHWSPTVKHSRFHFWHVFAEPGIFILDLIGEFTGVAHDQNRTFARIWLDLLQCGENEDGGLSKSRFGLAKNIGS